MSQFDQKTEWYHHEKRETLKTLSEYDKKRVDVVLNTLTGSPDAEKANLFALTLAARVLQHAAAQHRVKTKQLIALCQRLMTVRTWRSAVEQETA